MTAMGYRDDPTLDGASLDAASSSEPEPNHINAPAPANQIDAAPAPLHSFLLSVNVKRKIIQVLKKSETLCHIEMFCLYEAKTC
jgi:hypothetical protein